MTDELDHAKDDEAVSALAGARAHSGADPVNRALTYAVLALVAAVVAVLGYAVYATMRPAQQPRTAVERQILGLEAQLRSDPRPMILWVDYLSALIVAGQNTKAITVVEQGLRVQEDKAPLMVKRAQAEYALGRKDAAMATATDALKTAYAYRTKIVDKYWREKAVLVRAPDSDAIVDAEILRAKVYLERAKTSEAIASYTAALKVEPRMADVLVMRGEAYIVSDETAKARSDFQEALKYDPTNADALAGLARTKGESK
jgi:tetratricopeptide (TPR) repeat protein